MAGRVCLGARTARPPEFAMRAWTPALPGRQLAISSRVRQMSRSAGRPPSVLQSCPTSNEPRAQRGRHLEPDVACAPISRSSYARRLARRLTSVRQNGWDRQECVVAGLTEWTRALEVIEHTQQYRDRGPELRCDSRDLRSEQRLEAERFDRQLVSALWTRHER
jgi:hypothetical protein